MLSDFLRKVAEYDADYSFLISSLAQKIKREFYNKPNDEFIMFVEKEPDFSQKEIGAFCCGLIELLCNKASIPKPSWIYKKCYRLERPFDSIHRYSNVYDSLINLTAIEFSSRNYYTNEDGLLV